MTHPLTDKMIEDIAYDSIQSDETVKTGGLGVPAYHEMFLTEEPLALLYPNGSVMLRYDDMRVAYDKGYDKGYAAALEDVYVRLPEDAQDIITCIQRKNSPSTPITLEELKDL